MRARRLRSFFSYLLISGGALFLFVGGRDLVESQLGQSQAEREFQIAPTYKPSPFSAASEAVPQLGDAIAKLSIPRLQTDLYVVEGDGTRQLRRGPGHVKGSAMPGANGNCLIAGHRDTHFRILKDIREGDEIILQTRGGEYIYRVKTTQVVSPRDVKSLEPTQDAQLHLITCYPFYYLGSAPKRFIVQAQLQTGSSAVLTSGKPAKPILAAGRTPAPAWTGPSSKMN